MNIEYSDKHDLLYKLIEKIENVLGESKISNKLDIPPLTSEEIEVLTNFKEKLVSFSKKENFNILDIKDCIASYMKFKNYLSRCFDYVQQVYKIFFKTYIESYFEIKLIKSSKNDIEGDILIKNNDFYVYHSESEGEFSILKNGIGDLIILNNHYRKEYDKIGKLPMSYIARKKVSYQRIKEKMWMIGYSNCHDRITSNKITEANKCLEEFERKFSMQSIE